MAATVKQIGQISAQLKTQIDQFQASIDENDAFIERLKAHAITSRQADSTRTRDGLEYAEICGRDLQTSTSRLDNDTMVTSRMWETVSSVNAMTMAPNYYSRSFSSGRVAFTVPSNYFASVADRVVVNSLVIDSFAGELSKIEEYYVQQLSEDRRSPGDINSKVHAAMVRKIEELRNSGNNLGGLKY